MEANTMNLIFSVVLSAVLVGETDSRKPVPEQTKLDSAESELKELFAVDIKRAVSTADKAKLAKAVLESAIKLEGDEASRYVMLRMAKSYAIDGRDKVTAFEAAKLIVEQYQPTVEMDAKSLFEMGNKNYDIARKEKSAGKKIEAQVGAYECYLLAQTTATGITKQLCDRRLAELCKDSSGMQSDLKLLIGVWSAAAENDSATKWEFCSDGTVKTSNPRIPTGKWYAKTNQVEIRYDNYEGWDALTRPINPKLTSGVNWQGRSIHAEKIR